MFLRKEVKRIKTGSYRQVSFCKDCDFRFWCGGRCLVEQSQNYDDYCELRKYMIKLAFLLSATLEINFPFQLQIILSFLKEKNERFVGDKYFLLLVEKEKGLSFLELKNIYDFDKKRYNELLKKNMIKGENNDAKDCECNEEV